MIASFSERQQFLGKDCKWIIVSGSPCQDLTYAGTYGGYFGIVGAKIVFFLIAQHVIWWFVLRFGNLVVKQLNTFVKMQAPCSHCTGKMILWCLGLPEDTTPADLTWDPSALYSVKRARYFFQKTFPLIAIFLQSTFFAHSDFKPLINLKGLRVPVGPFLRVRHELKRGMLHLSWFAICSNLLAL